MGRTSEKFISVSKLHFCYYIIYLIQELHIAMYSHAKPEEKANVMSHAYKVIQKTLRENSQYFTCIQLLY